MSEAALLDRGIPIRNVWHMFLYAWDLLKHQGRFDTLVESAPSSSLLIAAMLAECLERRLRFGLARAYVPEEREIGAVRGRIDVLRSVRTQAFERGRVNCQFHAYSPDNPRNRLIKTSLAHLLAQPEWSKNPTPVGLLHRRLRRLLVSFQEVSFVAVTREAFRREVCGRNDSADQLVLALCELLYLVKMPTESRGDNPLLKADRDSALLRRVFERFVARFLQQRLSPVGWRVEPQKYLSWPVENKTRGITQYLPLMQVDVLLTNPRRNRQIIVDTKFTGVLGYGKYDSVVFKSPHLYQLYTYIRSQEATLPSCREGVLLYPATGRRFRERAWLQGILLRIETVDLMQPWHEIEQELLALFTESGTTEPV